MSLPKGKLSIEKLEKFVFPHLPRVDDTRAVALDFVTAEAQGRLVIASDPVIGIPLQYYGFFAVHYSATDVAMARAQPRYLSLGVYYPPETSEVWLETTMQQLGAEARKLEIQILGGHTGGYDGLTLPLISTTCVGTLPLDLPEIPPVSANDILIAVGPIGWETLWFLANVEPSQVDTVFPRSYREEISKNLEPFSIVPLIPQVPHQHIRLLHDLAEGGLATGLEEITKATNLGLTVHYDEIPWDEKALRLFTFLNWDPLHCSSFGSFLIAAPKDVADELIKTLQRFKRPVNIIGEFTKKRKLLLIRDGKSQPLKPGKDPYQKYTNQLTSERSTRRA